MACTWVQTVVVCSLLVALTLVFSGSLISQSYHPLEEKCHSFLSRHLLFQINVCMVKYGHFGFTLSSPRERLMFQLNGYSKDYTENFNFKWPRGEEACFTNCIFVLSMHLDPLIYIVSAPYDLNSISTMPLNSMWPASNVLYLFFLIYM